MKGLARSLSRGNSVIQPTTKLIFRISETFDITGSTGAAVFATAPISGLPEGNILYLGCVVYAKFDATGDTHVADAWNGDFSLGTSPTADATLNGAEVNLIASTAADAVAATKATNVIRAVSTTSQHGLILDNTDGSMEVNLNFRVDADEVTNAQVGTFKVTGHGYMLVSTLGDD